jgi:hypothetical protein
VHALRAQLDIRHDQRVTSPSADLDRWQQVIWSGKVAPVHRALDVDQPDAESTAATFRATVADRGSTATYWVKAINGPEGFCGLIAEAVVSRLGALIGAPVCETAFIDVTAFANWSYLPDRRLGPAYAYGSREIPDAEESRLVRHRTRADNRSRLARAFVLHQWCLGGDDQWLYATDDDYRIYSHDHGRWLLNKATWRKTTPPAWSATSLHTVVDAVWDSNQLQRGTIRTDVRSVAEFIGGVTHPEIVAALDPIAGAWGSLGITFPDGLRIDETLRRLGRWLEDRRDWITGRTTT